MPPPILYSFRRCPYAMRARMGLYSAQIPHEHREVALKDKPQDMLDASPKGTVPVFITANGQVIDESLDIMLWALSENDPEGWLCDEHRTDIFALIKQNDGAFKRALDRYKYPNRYPDEDCSHAREGGLNTLNNWDMRIESNKYLVRDKITLADIAIFPFVRQFAHVDRDWFYTLPLPHLQKWLQENLTSDLFEKTMKKHEKWAPKNTPTYTE